jgi:class 3 adenylate cyclase
VAAVGSIDATARESPRSAVPGARALRSLPRRERGGWLAFLVVVLVVVAIGAVCAVSALRWVDRPFMGFLLTPAMTVSSVAVADWSGTRAGLIYPDKIVRADGEPVASIHQLDTLIRRAGVGTPVRYTAQRKGRAIEVSVASMRFTWTDLLVTFGVMLASGSAYLVIAGVVFLLKPNTAQTWAFVVMCVALSVRTLIEFDVQTAQWRFVHVALLSEAILPAAAIHLSLVFPARKRIVERVPRLVAGLYLASAALAGGLVATYATPPFYVIYPVVRGYTLLAALLLVGSTLHVYWAASSPLARQRAKVVLFGAALAFPIPALQALSIFFGNFMGKAITQTHLIMLPLLVFPSSIAYAIARHNLFDVDVYIKRAVGYGVMTALVAVAYVSLQTVLNALVLEPIFGAQGEAVYPVFFALLVVLGFNPVQRRVQEAIDRVFFRKRFDYKETISAVTQALTSMLNLDQILEQVVRTIRGEMFVDAAGVIVLDRQQRRTHAFFAGEGELGQAVRVGYDDPMLALLRENRMLVTRYDIEEDPRYRGVKDACLRSFGEMAASVAIPLVYQGELTGVLAVGHKKSGQFYGRDDVDLLTTMAAQAAVAIENATTHEEVVRYARELEDSLRRIQILESIKTNLAKFVPKTVQELIEESPEAPLLEKREVDCSVLFADITGYTRLSAQMEMDQVNRLVERYFGAFLDEILARGGDVNETAGDGLMVIFRKKDPRRHARAAVRAALGIQERARQINAELQGQSEPIVMKVGVNSGIAAVGATRIEGAAGTRWTYTASGPTTNVAARLAALAEGAAGGVVVSEETRSRLGDEFRVEDLGPQSLKNVPEPVRAFRVAGRAAPPPPDAARDAERPLRLYVVPRHRPDVFEELARRFEGAPDVEVILDRRSEEPGPGPGPGTAGERRRPDRRERPAEDADGAGYHVFDLGRHPDASAGPAAPSDAATRPPA